VRWQSNDVTKWSSFDDTPPGAYYQEPVLNGSYTVTAFDAAGNVSAPVQV
jgi:phage terminase large subunit-like protein